MDMIPCCFGRCSRAGAGRVGARTTEEGRGCDQEGERWWMARTGQAVTYRKGVHGRESSVYRRPCHIPMTTMTASHNQTSTAVYNTSYIATRTFARRSSRWWVRTEERRQGGSVGSTSGRDVLAHPVLKRVMCQPISLTNHQACLLISLQRSTRRQLDVARPRSLQRGAVMSGGQLCLKIFCETLGTVDTGKF